MRVVPVLCLLVTVAFAGCSGSGGEAAETEDKTPQGNLDRQDEDDLNVTVEQKEGDQVEAELFLTVLAPHGERLKGTKISILGTSLTEKTGSDGVAHFEGLPADRHTLRLQAKEDHYKTVEVNVTVHPAAITRATVTLPLAEGLLSPPHIHNLWEGRDRFELFSATHDTACVGSQSTCVEPDGDRVNAYRFPPEAVVPVGTARMHVTATWDSPFEFHLAMVGPGEEQDPLVFESSGETQTLELVAEDWDPPHASNSLWNYEFDGATDRPGVWPAPYTITVEVERIEGDLPYDPPHPDRWEGRQTIRVADAEASAGAFSTHTPHTTVNKVDYILFDHPVLPGTKELRFQAWVNFTLEPQDMELWYDPQGRTASDSDLEDPRTMVASSEDGMYYEWVLPVTSAWWDPMYASESDWHFRIIPARDETTGSSNGAFEMHAVVDAIKQ